ncbi:Colicin E3 catalytic [Thalassoporum mexicanum PCC 7367]|uniref:colicin E3/pyocin S6 family cytotoxin n=1 Tax=Thalassoporum mexicanum TaxID=3457544 RepID=UPI00029FB4B9|nr:colicin E3/pyocin S6 family cytotoxin [Pseudanabaena sp. PCC 7367]AFY68366.1 Colicin E3 catalytic [Pseudanabaena sp. PCC 7367]
MGGKPIPKPSILDECKVVGIEAGRKVYKDKAENRYYMWDSLHGEVEVFNKRGTHIGVACPITGKRIKPAVKGRKISKQN